MATNPSVSANSAGAGLTAEPEARKAPGDLELVQAFINTVDLRPYREELRDPSALHNWFADHGLLGRGERVSECDLRHALEVREALRDLLAVAVGGKPSHASVHALSRAARGAQLVVQFDENGQAELVPGASGVDHALGRLIAIATTAILRGTWQRLKACEDETCRWAFYDWSKNRSGNWCSMSSCGNRSKARRHRTRRRQHGKGRS